ncbi:MAG: SLC13 family permease [Prevotella sp.]|nr:SLC13 family permease [Prevotella sp.]
MVVTLIVLCLTVALFITGKVRADVVALCALVILSLTGILTPQEALSGFSSEVVIMMAGLFVISGAIIQTGLAKGISARIMRLSRGNETLTFLLVMLTTSFIGAVVSNTGTVALMMPIVVSMAAATGKSPSRLLMPIAFASSMGGMLTLIGTPPNLIINDALTAAGFRSLKFFSLFPVGLVVIATGIIVLMPLSKRFLEKKSDGKKGSGAHGKDLNELVAEYHLQNNMRAFRIIAGSQAEGKSVAELDLRRRYGLSILEIRKTEGSHGRIIRKVKQKVASAATRLEAGDIIYITGSNDAFERFCGEFKVKEVQMSGIDFYDIGMAEIVVMPGSKMAGSRIKDSNIRDQLNINIVGIRRKKDYITADIATQTMMPGDVLLVQGSWRNIGKLESGGDWVVLGRPLEQLGHVILDYKAPVATLIMLLMILSMVFDFIPINPITAIMAAALLMVLTGCLRSVEAAYKTIHWESIVLIAAMMPMSIALEKTGTSAIVSHGLVAALGGIGPTALLAGVYFTTSLLTFFISNTATAVLMAPIALTAAGELGVSPYSFLVAVTLGASMCFASPFSTPPNVLVMRAGNYAFMDYIKVGLPLQILLGIAMTFFLPIVFPF